MPHLIETDGSSCQIGGPEWLSRRRRAVTTISISPSRAVAYAWYAVASLDDGTTFVERFDSLRACRRFVYGDDPPGRSAGASSRFPQATITDHTETPRYKHDHALYPGAVFLGRSHDVDFYVMPGPSGFVPMARTSPQSVIFPMHPLTPELLAQDRLAQSSLAVAYDLAVETGHIAEARGPELMLAVPDSSRLASRA
jgi:hypothetical protein